MADVIWGNVTNVVDGDTFDLHVTHVGKNNKEEYNDEERIRIASIDAPELPGPAGRQAKRDIERAILGKYVRCEIKSRDTFGRLVCDVSLAGRHN